MPHRLIRGIAVSPGVAVGPALVVRWETPVVPHRAIASAEVEGELARLAQAVAGAREGLERVRARAAERTGADAARIFEAQLLMLEDRDLLDGVERLIRENHFSAEQAFALHMLEWRGLWSTSESPMLRERLADLTDLEIRVVGRLIGRPESEILDARPDAPVVVVARDLTPSLTLQLDRDAVLGIATQEGTRISHSAILAHSLGIPAVVGLPGVLERVGTGESVVLDGWLGTVLVEPTPEDREAASVRDRQRRALEEDLSAAVELPTVTADGTAVAVRGNLDLPEELEAALRHGADGVGLMRTEFLVVGRAAMPSEEQQAALYRRVGAAFGDRPVVIRTYDLGGDKYPMHFGTPLEANPFLGWRAIRVCMDRPDVFRPQVRALLRAAHHARLRLMIPLVTRLEEVSATRELVQAEAANLAREGVEAAPDIPVGVMVETPAAVVIVDRLAAASDFLSVGTNDLVQYTLAVDRGNARLASRFTPHHQAVLRFLAQIQRAAQAAGREVSVCGEMASDPFSVYLLIGMGYRVLSVAVPSIPLIKWMVRQISFADAAVAAEAALELERVEDVGALVRERLGDVVDLRLLDPAAPLPARSLRASFRR